MHVPHRLQRVTPERERSRCDGAAGQARRAQKPARAAVQMESKLTHTLTTISSPTVHLLGWYAALVGIGMTSASLGPTLPTLAVQTHTTLSDISALFLTRSLGYIAGSLIAGRLYDRLSGNPIVAGALITLAAAMTLVPLTPSLWHLAVVMGIAGSVEGAVDIGTNTLLLWTFHGRVGP